MRISEGKFRRAAVASLALSVAVPLAVLPGQARAEDGVFRFGVPYPQTGAYAEYGANFADGVRLAVQDINAAGGIAVNGDKVKVEAVFCDTQANSATAAACGRRLTAQDRVTSMVVATSIETYPILSFNTTVDPQFLVISSSASNKLADLGNPLVARYWFNTYKYMPGFTKLIHDSLPEVKVIAQMQSEDEFGKAWADTFDAGWTAAGGTSGGVATYAHGSTDFYPQLTALLRSDPDALAVPGPCPGIAPIVNQARELGYEGRFILQASCGPDEAGTLLGWDNIAGSIFEGTGWDRKSGRAEAFRADFKKTFDREPVIMNADGYGQAMWLFNAVEAAGSTSDAMAIRAAMAQVTERDWNILEIGNLEPSGETTALVYPRVAGASEGQVVDYHPGN